MTNGVLSLWARARGAARVLRLRSFDTATVEGRWKERDRRVVLTTLVSVFNRFGASAVALISVPLALRYLGAEEYGIWVTLISASAWLGFLNLGLGPSLLNHLSAATGRDDADLGRRLVATAWWLQAGITLLAAAGLAAVYVALPWAAIFNVTDPGTVAGARQAAAAVWLGMLMQMPLAIALYTYQAHQEGYLSGLWQLPIPVIQLLGLVAVMGVDGGLPLLAVTFSAAPLLCMGAGTLFLFARRRRDLLPRPSSVDRQLLGPLARTGAGFTGISLAALVILYSDNLVITQALGPASVTPYATTFLLIRLLISVQQMFLDAVWPAYSEAAARQDGTWLRRAHARVNLTCILMAVAAVVPLLLVGRPAIGAWAGPAAVPSYGLLAAMAFMALVQASLMPVSRLVTALGAVHVSMWLGVANAAVNLPASIVLAGWIGLPGVALGTAVGYLSVAWLQVAYARKVMARVPSGVVGMQPQPVAPS